MRRQYIKGNDNTPFEILEDDKNASTSESVSQTAHQHRYDAKLEKLSEETKKSLKKERS